MKKHAGPIFAAVLLLLPVLYVGSYLALVTPGDEGLNVYINHGSWDYPYRFGGRVSAIVFWPLEQIDRKVRREAWEDGFWNTERSGRAPILHLRPKHFWCQSLACVRQPHEIAQH